MMLLATMASPAAAQVRFEVSAGMAGSGVVVRDPLPTGPVLDSIPGVQGEMTARFAPAPRVGVGVVIPMRSRTEAVVRASWSPGTLRAKDNAGTRDIADVGIMEAVFGVRARVWRAVEITGGFGGMRFSGDEGPFADGADIAPLLEGSVGAGLSRGRCPPLQHRSTAECAAVRWHGDALRHRNVTDVEGRCTMTRVLLRSALLFSCVLAAACDSPTLPATARADFYEFRLNAADSLHVLRWPMGTNLRVYLHPGSSPADATLMAQAFERGAATWNAQALFAEYRIVRASSIVESDVVMRWSADPAPLDVTGCIPGFSSGVTTFCLRDPDDPSQGLLSFPPLPPSDPEYDGVKMLVSILSSQAPIAGRAEALITHELGHVLGIARHSPFADDLMAAVTPTRTTLARRDINTVRLLYRTEPDITP